MKKIQLDVDDVNQLLDNMHKTALQLEGHFWRSGVNTADGEQLDRIADALAHSRNLVGDVAVIRHKVGMMERADE